MKENDFLDKAVDELKRVGANSSPPQQIIDKTLDRLSGLENEHRRIMTRGGWTGFLKLAAAALILLTAGVFAGRLTKPAKLDTGQLATLEKTLKSSIETQLSNDLQEKLEQNFTALVQVNNEQLSELTSSIDDTQQWHAWLLPLCSNKLS